MPRKNLRAIAHIEPVIAYWPDCKTTYERLGDVNYSGDGSSEQFMIRLRAVTQDLSVPSKRLDAVRKITLYVWISNNLDPDWSYKIEVLCDGLRFADAEQLIEQSRVVRALARAVPWNDQYLSNSKDPFEQKIRATLKSLGIDRASFYPPGLGFEQTLCKIEDRFEHYEGPSFSVIDDIVNEFARRRAKILQYRRAA